MKLLFFISLLFAFQSLLPGKGIVLIARSEDCGQLDALTRHLDSMKAHYKTILVNDDPVTSNYIKEHYKGECPLVFVDNIFRGTGSDFMISLDNEVIYSAWI